MPVLHRYPNLNKGFKKKLQVTQNKCMCLQLGNMSHMGAAEFDKINWLPIDDRFNQCASSKVFKFFQDVLLTCLKFFILQLVELALEHLTLKLIQPSRRTSQGQRSLSYQGPVIWNKLPDSVKQSSSVNSFKHNLKSHYFADLKRREKELFIY